MGNVDSVQHAPLDNRDHVALDKLTAVALWARGYRPPTVIESHSQKIHGGASDYAQVARSASATDLAVEKDLSKVFGSGTADIPVGQRSAWSSLRQFKHLLVLVILGTFQSTILPSVPYIVNTFFAAAHGGGDCEKTPKSEPCRMGAVDAAFYHGWSNAISNVFAMFLALGYGSYSDAVGRRPLIRCVALLWSLPLLALTFHLMAGLSLWFYLIIVPVLLTLDLNGVYMALMSDLVPEPEERAGAFGLFMGVLMIVSGIAMPIAYLVPRRFALYVSLIAYASRLTYLFTAFPETISATASADDREGVMATAKSAFRLLTRHSFIFRMSTVLAVSGLASSGFVIVMPPFMTGYLGFERIHQLYMFMACGASMMISFLCVLGPLTARFGDVKVLQISLSTAVAFPVLCGFCTEIWHLIFLMAIFSGPLCLCYPVVMAIKSNLVAQDEQGLVQGAVASIGKATATIGFLLFSVLFKVSSRDGEVKSRNAVLMPFLTIAGIQLIALLLACSLPRMPPPPTNDSSSNHQSVEPLAEKRGQYA